MRPWAFKRKPERNLNAPRNLKESSASTKGCAPQEFRAGMMSNIQLEEGKPPHGQEIIPPVSTESSAGKARNFAPEDSNGGLGQSICRLRSAGRYGSHGWSGGDICSAQGLHYCPPEIGRAHV